MIGGERAARISTRGRCAAARRAIAVLALAALVGCAQAPVPHGALATADLAMARARTAGAAHHASAELARAEAKLEAARAAVQAKAHERARTLAEQALVDAELAEVKAQAVQAEASARGLRDRMELQHRRLAPADNGT